MPRLNENDQFKFLISCIRYSNNGKVDFAEVAKECKIVSKGAAAKRYERMMKQHGIHQGRETYASMWRGNQETEAPAPKPRKRRRGKSEDYDDDDDEEEPVPNRKQYIKAEVEPKDQNEPAIKEEPIAAPEPASSATIEEDLSSSFPLDGHFPEMAQSEFYGYTRFPVGLPDPGAGYVNGPSGYMGPPDIAEGGFGGFLSTGSGYEGASGPSH